MAELGRHTYSMSGDMERADIGDFCSIAGGVTFHADDNHACIYDMKLVSTFPFDRWSEDYPHGGGGRRTKIGNDVWIGEGASILAGVVVADGAIIGAHSVVTKDVPAYAVVTGNPARVKKYRFTAGQIKELLRIKWWLWEDQVIKQRIGDLKSVNEFIKKYK